MAGMYPSGVCSDALRLSFKKTIDFIGSLVMPQTSFQSLSIFSFQNHLHAATDDNQKKSQTIIHLRIGANSLRYFY